MAFQLLVPIHTYPQQTSLDIVRSVAAVSRHLKADVHALISNVTFPSVSSPFGNLLIDIPALVRDAKAKSRADGTEIANALRKEVLSLGHSFQFTEVECPLETFQDSVILQGRYHDFSVIGLDSRNRTSRAIAEAVMFACGRPTLLLPEHEATATFDHVLIAWDGSRVATRATADSWPFLQRARSITIASIVDEKPLPHGDLGDRLARYLSHHELQANVIHLQRGDHPVSEALQNYARQNDAGLMVMGAFGHTRVRDFVLGGATSGILGELRVPTLLSH